MHNSISILNVITNTHTHTHQEGALTLTKELCRFGQTDGFNIPSEVVVHHSGAVLDEVYLGTNRLEIYTLM